MKNINFFYRIKPLTFALQMKNYIPFLLAIVLFSCKSANKNTLLSANDFSNKITTENSVVLDVRTPDEFNAGHLNNAININFESADFDQQIAQLDKSKTYAVYCLKGVRSGKAMDKMQSLGFKNIYGLDGGIEAWQSANLPLANTVHDTAKVTQPTSDVIPDFKTAIYGDKLVMVDFNAVWCGPCRRMQPFVDLIKEERSSEVLVYGIDTDENPQLAQEYQIYNLPTVIFLKKGAVLYRQEGYHDQKALNDLVTKFK